jgi:hypothetical protein
MQDANNIQNAKNMQNMLNYIISSNQDPPGPTLRFEVTLELILKSRRENACDVGVGTLHLV